MAQRQIDRVQVATARRPGIIEVSWDGRQALLERLRGRDDADLIVSKFEAAGSSSPIRLAIDEKELVYAELQAWLIETPVAALPAGVWDLRCALADDLHDAIPDTYR